MECFDSLPSGQCELMLKHLDLVIKANERVNLTRIDDVDEALVLHVEDSLSGLPEVEDAPDGLYADLGSGAGYPGIPLAVATGRETLLVDARKKKMDVVREMIGELGLSDQIDVFAGRAELLARKKPRSFALITARALSQLSILLELASPLLAEGGRLVCYKSHIEDEELENAQRVQKLVGMSLCSDRSFELEGKFHRRILVFERHGSSKIKLPRLEGEAQKNPL